MALVNAPQRGPLGATEVDFNKQTLVFDGPANVYCTVNSDGSAVNLTQFSAPIYNDWGGELRLSHARVTVQGAAFPYLAFDGVTKLDVRVDGVSVFPADPITGLRDYIEIDASSGSFTGSASGAADTFVFNFTDDAATWPDGSQVSLWVVDGPLDNGTGSDYAAFGAYFMLYAFPTGK